MIEHNWLMAYASLEGVGITLQRLSERIRFDNPLAESQPEIIKHYTKLDEGFSIFFPELITHIKQVAIESQK